MMKKALKISYPNSDRVYVSGTIHPSVRVSLPLSWRHMRPT